MATPLNKIQDIPSHPQVVSTVACAADVANLAEVMGQLHHPDIVELRLDHLGPLLEHAVTVVTALEPAPPILLTARRPDEGGSGGLNFEHRKALITDHLAVASLVDIEIRSLESEHWEEVLQEIRSLASPPLVIGSFHNFELTPAAAELEAVIELGMRNCVDIVKIATRISGADDLARLEALLHSPPIPLSVMGMSEESGQASRIRLARAGSVLNYGYTAQESAPGQWQANELVEQLQECRRN